MRSKTLKISLILMLVFSFSSCQAMRSDLTAVDMKNALTSLVSGADTYVACSERYLASVFDLSVEVLPDHACVRDADLSQNELGVFACENEAEAKELVTLIREGLTKRSLHFDDRYFNGEKTKIERAEAVQMGRYVLYCILEDGEKNAVIQQFYNILKGVAT